MPDSLGIILTTYGSRAAQGRNLGSAGYSYDFVVRQFVPWLRECGAVVELPPDPAAVDRESVRLRRQGRVPLHLCFMPFQHAVLAENVLNVVVPAWEFPDLPDEPFDGEAQNDWVMMANRCAAVIVGGPWTADVFRRGGVRCPVHVVPVPTGPGHFDVSDWSPAGSATVDCPAVDGGGSVEPAAPKSQPSRAGSPASLPGSTAMRQMRSGIARLARATYKRGVRPLLPSRVDASLTAGLTAAANAWNPAARSFHRLDRLELSGVVYTSIFNPDDGRKNWEDLISAFLIALRDCPDATLVLKLIVRQGRAADDVLRHVARLDVSHRCRLRIVTDFLTAAQMRDLARATTYYITSTRAEGNCLPLMDYLAAGRPAVSPRHTAIGDYFSDRCGFVVESHPEPTAWPQDSRLRCRTTWARIVWSSLAQQIRRSYDLARNDAGEYARLSAACRRTMQGWSHPRVVVQQLRAALQACARQGEQPGLPARRAA